MAFNLTEPQTEFFNSQAPVVCAVAGMGSGKTMVSTLKMLSLMLQYPYVDVCYAAPTHALIRQILYPKVAEILEDANIAFKINKAENIISIQNHGMIICKTLENPDLLVGFEVASVFLDELDLLTMEKAESSFMKLAARIRQKFKPITLADGTVYTPPNQMFITTTPEGFKWTYENFVKNPIKNSHLIKMSTYSNKANLPEGYIESLEDKFGNSPLLKAYLNGEFVSMEGNRVLPNFDRMQCDSNRELLATDRTIYISADFNVTKQEAVVWVKDEVKDEETQTMKSVFTAVDELNKMYDTPEMIAIVKERYGDKQVYWYPDASSAQRKTVDASKSDMSMMRECGIVRVRSKNPLVKDRVAANDVAFKEGRLKINTRLCPNTVEALEQMTYDSNGRPDKTLPVEHAFDAATYLAAYEFPIDGGGKATVSNVRMW